MDLISRQAAIEAIGKNRQDLLSLGMDGAEHTLVHYGRRVIEEQPTIDAVEVVRCGKCRHYQGNHDVPGCAPCDFWGIGGVMWDDFCKRGERGEK